MLAFDWRPADMTALKRVSLVKYSKFSVKSNKEYLPLVSVERRQDTR